MSRVTEANTARKLKVLNRQLGKILEELLMKQDSLEAQTENITTTHNLFIEFLTDRVGEDEMATLRDGFEEWIKERNSDDDAGREDGTSGDTEQRDEPEGQSRDQETSAQSSASV